MLRFNNSLRKEIEDTAKKEAVPSFIQALTDGNAIVRKEAAYVLGKIKDERAVKPLIEALILDLDMSVKKEAVWALENIGKPSVESLIEALKNEDSVVR